MHLHNHSALHIFVLAVFALATQLPSQATNNELDTMMNSNMSQNLSGE
jgi:hypothetical protein